MSADSKIIAVWAALVVLLLSSAAATAVDDGGEEARRREHVSILRVTLSCGSLEGEWVTVVGAISLGLESQAICPTEEFLKGDRLSCLWLAVDEVWTAAALAQVQEKAAPGTYVVVDGKVSCENRGFGGLYGAALEEISLIAGHPTGEMLWSADAAAAKERVEK